MWLRLVAVALAVGAALEQASPVFVDDFEQGLGRWRVIGERAIAVRDSGDPMHGKVMTLTPNGDVAAIMRGSEAWGRVRVEGDMLFPSAVDNYLGFVYHFTERNRRRDFGLIYLKGNDNYLQVNPHRDFNVSRLIYPEGRAALTGADRVAVNRWQRFALEVDATTAHIYIGDSAVPQITFDLFEFRQGELGFQPRSVGGPVWIDNVTVRSLDRLSYAGAPIPAVLYDPGSLMTSWQVAGPFAATDDRIAQQPAGAQWVPFAADRRGAVVTGRITDYHGPNTVAYFRGIVESPTADDAEIQFSTADDLAVWVNGEFQSFVARQDAAWFDFASNKAHAPRRVAASLRPGRNDIVIRVRGGVYATGGFYARLLRSS